MKFLKNISLTFKIFITSVLLCFVALSIMATINYNQATQRIKRFHQNNFNKKEQNVLKSFEYFISDTINFNQKKIEKKIIELARINQIVIEFYDPNYDYVAGNIDNYKTKKLNKSIVESLISNKNNKIKFDSIENKSRTYSYTKIFLNQEEKGILSIIYFKNNHLLKSEINQLWKQYIILMLFLIFLSAFLAWIISNNLTKKIKEIALKITNTDIIQNPEFLKYNNLDEITPLIDSYNKMLEKITFQKEIISKTEKEETWREMAKQVAHEINNPLTPMKLSIQNFKKNFNTNDTQKNQLKVDELSEMLIQQIELIATISNSFTNFSKMPEKNDEYLEIINLTKSILFVFSKENIVFNHHPENIYLKFDKLSYIRIITNIIKNAIQANENCENSKIIINIAESNEVIKISIQDFGKGIDPEYQNKIFDNNFTTKKSGLGIGLFMVKKIIESYQGRIWFDSKENIGTTFYIELNNIY